jgi:ABC-2 type transport system permease protein
MSTTAVATPPTVATPPSRGTSLTGTWRLVRLAFRRDRVLLPIWVLALLGLLVVTVASIVSLYGAEADRVQYALVAATNVVARAFDGPMAGTSLGAITMTESFGILALLTGIMSVQAIVRHTRLEEETGRAELVGSAVVGHHARLVAALLVVAAVDILLGVAAALTLAAWGLPVGGAALAGAALAGVGLTFAGVAAVAAQISETARGANTIGIAVVGIAFLLRAIGDATGRLAESGVEVISAWPSWLSPIGWGQQVRPFGGDRVWVLGLFLVAALALVVLAFVLTAHRDVGFGMVAVRPGPPTAAPSLLRPFGLVLRLQRGAFVGWAIGLAVMAAAIGGISHEVEDLLQTSDELAALIAAMGGGDALVDLYIAFALVFLAYAAAAYLIQTVLRARAEEVAGRAEPLLATAVSRTRYLGVHTGFSVAGVVGIVMLIGLVGGTTAGLVAGDWRLGDWVLAAAVQLPAVLVLGGVVVAAIGWAPRAAVPIGWAVLVVSLVIGQFGGLLELPQLAMNLSPFTHVPPVPAEDLRVMPLAVLLAVAIVLHVIGFLGWGRRDVTC